jgi:hypothetical protein
MAKTTKTYQVSKESFYDEDKQLWETHIGTTDEEKKMVGSAWAETKDASRKFATKIALLLNKSVNLSPVIL